MSSVKPPIGGCTPQIQLPLNEHLVGDPFFSGAATERELLHGMQLEGQKKQVPK